MSSPLLRRLAALLFTFALIAGACGGDDDDDVATTGADSGEESSETPEASETPAVAPTAVPVPGCEAGAEQPDEPVNLDDPTLKPEFVVSEDAADATELATTDIIEGGGIVAAAGDFVVMQYVGRCASTGREFDSSWDRGQPFTFTLGTGSVIQGWEEGVAGMSVGSRRELVIPADLAYGDQGSGSGSIGPGEPLVFVVDLQAVVPADREKPEVVVPLFAAEQLSTEDLIEGDGYEIGPGDAVYIHYVGVSQGNDAQFDASWDRGIDQMLVAILGQGRLIAGFEQGLEGMKVGGRRQIIIPPELAYGENSAAGGAIAENDTLIFVIDLLGAVNVIPAEDLAVEADPDGAADGDATDDSTAEADDTAEGDDDTTTDSESEDG